MKKVSQNFILDRIKGNSSSSKSAPNSENKTNTPSSSELPGNHIPAKKTPLNQVELAEVLKDSYSRVFGKDPTAQELGVAWSQVSLETGQGQKIYNNNLGNITATKSWISNGNPYHSFGNITEFDSSGKPQKYLMKFRSYNSAVDSGVDYWKSISTTFKDAFKWFGTGDALHSGLALGDKTYYTANRIKYSGAMSDLYNQFIENVAPRIQGLVSNPIPPPGPPPEFKKWKDGEREAIPEKYVANINKNTLYTVQQDGVQPGTPDVITPATREETHQMLVEYMNERDFTPESASQFLDKYVDNNQHGLKKEEAKNILDQYVSNKQTNVVEPDVFVDQAEQIMNSFSNGPIQNIVKKAYLSSITKENRFIIRFAGDRFENRIKAARVFAKALREEFNTDSCLCSDGIGIEIDSSLLGDTNSVGLAVRALAEHAMSGFNKEAGASVRGDLLIGYKSELSLYGVK